MSVLYRIVEKKDALELDNLIIILGDATNLLEYFDESSLDVIYLNFSDPWPKSRHHKRRLTYYSFLKLYKKLLKSNGILQFRTDVLPFFEDSVTYVESLFDIFDQTYDLEISKYMTEYEEKKRKIGKINH